MAKPRGNHVANGMSGYLTCAILVLALLHVGQSIFIPLAFSLFIIALAWPLQKALQRRMPQLLALLLTLSLTVVIIVALASTVAWGLTKLAQWLFANLDRFQLIHSEWADWMEDHGIAIGGTIADRFDMNWLLGMTQALALRLNSLAGFGVLVFILVMLGLLECGDFRERLRLPGAQPYGETILAANREIGRKLQRYMVVRSLASVLTGIVVWGFAALAGLELAAAWGAIAFALNYIPFLGPLIATVFPTLFAIAQFESWEMAVIVFICLNLVQFVIGSYFEPLVTGASLAISPFAVIFAVFFWSFIWGLAGAFIGVPILIAFIVYCAQFPGSKWIAILLSGGAIRNSESIDGRI